MGGDSITLCFSYIASVVTAFFFINSNVETRVSNELLVTEEKLYSLVLVSKMVRRVKLYSVPGERDDTVCVIVLSSGPENEMFSPELSKSM